MSVILSVVIPVYNGADFIADTVRAALAQTFRDFEIVIVNDGSRDATLERLAPFGDAVRVISIPNGGVSNARNIGIGASTALFSAVDTFLLAPVRGVGNADQLVELGRVRRGNRAGSFSYPGFADTALRAKDFATLFGYAMEPLNVSISAEPQRALGMVVSGNYFETLGVQAWRGRLFTPADDLTPGAHPLAVLSYGYWQRRFGGDPAIIGAKQS
jgi:hypothetical protein